MKRRKSVYFSASTTILMICALLPVPVPSNSQLEPIQIWGEVALHNEYNLPFKIKAEFTLHDSGRRPIVDARIMFNDAYGVPLFNAASGNYRRSITDLPDDPNTLYTIAFRRGQIGPLVEAEGRITGRANFISPTPNQIINLAAYRFISIHWRLTNASGYEVQIRVSETPHPGGGEGPVAIFFSDDYSGDTVVLPSSKFQPNRHYKIRLIVKAPVFAFSRGTRRSDLAPGSIIYGEYWTERYFSTR